MTTPNKKVKYNTADWPSPPQKKNLSPVEYSNRQEGLDLMKPSYIEDDLQVQGETRAQYLPDYLEIWRPFPNSVLGEV